MLCVHKIPRNNSTSTTEEIGNSWRVAGLIARLSFLKEMYGLSLDINLLGLLSTPNKISLSS